MYLSGSWSATLPDEVKLRVFATSIVLGWRGGKTSVFTAYNLVRDVAGVR